MPGNGRLAKLGPHDVPVAEPIKLKFCTLEKLFILARQNVFMGDVVGVVDDEPLLQATINTLLIRNISIKFERFILCIVAFRQFCIFIIVFPLNG